MAKHKSTTDRARLAAHALLSEVVRKKRLLDEALPSVMAQYSLEGRDRGFARNLVATTLRRLGQIDDLIARCLDNPLPKKANMAMDIMRLGACQLMFLDTPPHAAVGTSVELADALAQGPYKKLVNAILRRLSREGQELLAEQDEARLNTLIGYGRLGVDTYGEKVTRAIATAHLSEAPLDLSVAQDPAALAVVLEADCLPGGTLRRSGGGAVELMPGFEDGTWWVQDVAASLPVALLGDVAGQRVLDLCAAPGGKTAQLAVKGAQVTALDRSAPRLKRLTQNLQRLKLRADVLVEDATNWTPAQLFDAVLLDAPCSATGTLRRHPDVALHKGLEDVRKLANLQARLLAKSATFVKPGGTVIYCTCSLQKNEGSDQIQAALKNIPELELVPILPDDLPGFEFAVTEDGYLRTLPCHLREQGGMDGFFAARLRRKG